MPSILHTVQLLTDMPGATFLIPNETASAVEGISVESTASIKPTPLNMNNEVDEVLTASSTQVKEEQHGRPRNYVYQRELHNHAHRQGQALRYEDTETPPLNDRLFTSVAFCKHTSSFHIP
jgi:hypothetical protein